MDTIPIWTASDPLNVRDVSSETPTSVVVRDATEADSESLRRLVRTATVDRGVRWTIDRESDFFTPFRPEAGGWRVVIAEEEDGGTAVGWISVVTRDAYVDGRVQRTCYVSNLLVRPERRGQGIGDRLCGHALEICRSAGGNDVPILLAIRRGNPHMRHRIVGLRGLPGLRPFAEMSIHSIGTRRLRRMVSSPRLEISAATPADVEDMAAFSQKVFRARQFAPAFNAQSLAGWIADAPGLTLADYLVARDNGTVVGWLGVWDEAVIRRVRVAGYSRRAALRYALRDALAPITQAPRAPRVGDVVGCAVAVHVCVDAQRPEVLRAILVHAAHGLERRGCAWLRIALDSRDPLASALDGLPANVSLFGAHVATPADAHRGPRLDDRPVHFEAALA